MLESKIYNQEGKETGKIKLPASVFDAPWNADLVHQVAISQMANQRTPVAHTKGRSEVRGGGRKPWRQKGTGRARHGSIRSPIWRGGGVTFGPTKEKKYTKKINRKMKTKALYATLSQKLRDGEIIFVDKISFEEPKTASAKNILSAIGSVKGFEGLSTKKRNAALIAMLGKDAIVQKSFNNLGNIVIDEVRNLNALDTLNFKYLVITNPKESVEFLNSKSESSKE